LPPCASVTITSVAPPSNAPSIAALTSRVMRSRARSYSALDVGRAERPSAGVTWTQLETPAVPSMSAEIRIFMGASHDAGGPTGRAEPAVEIEPVLWHEAYRAPADQLDAGDLGGMAGADLVVEVQFDDGARGQDVGPHRVDVADGPLGRLADHPASLLWLQVDRRGHRIAVLDDRALDLLAEQFPRLLDCAIVAGDQGDRHAEMPGGDGIDAVLARRDAVDTDILQPQRPGVGQRPIRCAGSGVIAGEENGVDAVLDARHHDQRLVAAGHELRFRVQLLGDQVAHAVVGVVDDHLGRTAGQRALNRGIDFVGHP